MVFATNGTTQATSSDISDYNSFVTQQALQSPTLSALNTNWHAIGRTSSINERTNTTTDPGQSVGVPIYRADGQLVANDNADLWDSTLNASISFDQHGSSITSNPFAWTGFNLDGFPNTRFLGGNEGVAFGEITRTNKFWAQATISSNPSLNNFRLYAMSDVLTFTAVPEPGSLLPAVILAATWIRRRRRKTCKTKN